MIYAVMVYQGANYREAGGIVSPFKKCAPAITWFVKFFSSLFFFLWIFIIMDHA